MIKKELRSYDLKRIISRAKKEYGIIPKGTEDDYNPQLDYIEHFIYKIYESIPITDTSLRTVIEIVLYDVKTVVEKTEYDYSKIVTKEEISFAQSLRTIFDPMCNENIKNLLKNVDLNKTEDLKKLYEFPVKCLLRIYDSIEFWNKFYGKNGYYRMLEEMVLPTKFIGIQPYALDDQYIEIVEENE